MMTSMMASRDMALPSWDNIKILLGVLNQLPLYLCFVFKHKRIRYADNIIEHVNKPERLNIYSSIAKWKVWQEILGLQWWDSCFIKIFSRGKTVVYIKFDRFVYSVEVVQGSYTSSIYRLCVVVFLNSMIEQWLQDKTFKLQGLWC